jgi:hypothetical protein
VVARVHCGGLRVKCGSREENTPTSAVLCSRRACDRSAPSIRVTASQLCWLVVLVIVTCFRCPSSLGQTQTSVNVQVDHDSWTFKEGAPADVACLAQTNDGFLWLGSANGLFRFDGTRSNHSGRRLAIGSSRPACILCSHPRLVVSGSVTPSEASVSWIRGESQIMEARLPLQAEVSGVLPRIGMESYGQPHPVVYGDSIIRGGSLSELSGTLRPD